MDREELKELLDQLGMCFEQEVENSTDLLVDQYGEAFSEIVKGIMSETATAFCRAVDTVFSEEFMSMAEHGVELPDLEEGMDQTEDGYHNNYLRRYNESLEDEEDY